MDEIELLYVDARKWLDKIDLIHLSRYRFDTSIKCDHVTNNMTGSFNSMLGEHRAKTYLCLLEYIRRMVMKRFQERKEACNRQTSELPPTIKAKLVKASDKSRMHIMLKAGNEEYELLGETRAYLTKLRLVNCKCGVWQVSGIPCSHAFVESGLYSQINRVADFVHPSLTKSAFLQTYGQMINPIPDRYVWPEITITTVLPPPLKTQSGKPKVRRRREPDVRPSQTRGTSCFCKNCGVLGHNKRTCKGPNRSKLTEVASSSQPQSQPSTQNQSQVAVNLQ
ncbi:hypothetical protein Ddye_008476 [Dipteronia dyeriana]|uniref:SWIM-type domain-containing protein n=1 Tax=Dipteronia dyeriana TaxID=168575 RepID=A0AAD9X9R8_9ROSI|nr:hypothetical protein Ddye_008476 [Dipteronia dyeriana]